MMARAPSRRPKWPEMDTFNKGLAQYVRQTKNVSFVDINPALNQASGDGKEGHYLPDNLHPSELGYKAILKVLRPAVDAAWKNTQRAFAKSPK